MTISEIQTKIEKLREEYKTAAGTNKDILRIRGLMLKIALEKKIGKQQ